MPEPSWPFQKTKSILDAGLGTVYTAYATGIVCNKKKFRLYGGCNADSLFDLASLTKILCTTLATAIAEERGLLNTDDAVRRYFDQDLGASLNRNPIPADLRIHHLLTHTSGLPAWLPLYEQFRLDATTGATKANSHDYYKTKIIDAFRVTSTSPALSTQYSDLGFLLLGWILEQVTGQTLDQFFQSQIADSLAAASATFNPTRRDHAIATEVCPWRGHRLQGEVHDDNCAVLGGVAGHAGLFANLEDTIKLAVAWLESFQGLGLIRAETTEKFWRVAPENTRPMGFDLPTPGGSTGRFFSPLTRGHLGFTGTSLWIDRTKDLIVVLLTNRVFFGRDPAAIQKLRPTFHDELLIELGFGSQ